MGKYRPEKAPNLDTYQAVIKTNIYLSPLILILLTHFVPILQFNIFHNLPICDQVFNFIHPESTRKS